jgi:hypothetical protein
MGKQQQPQQAQGNHTYIAKVVRNYTELGQVEIILYPIADDQMVELHEGDEFVSITCIVDLFRNGSTTHGC